MRLTLLFLALVGLAPLNAATELYKDEAGDIRLKDADLKCMDIVSVKVTTPNRKVFTFEVKTREDIVRPSPDCYFVIGINLDGDLTTGSSLWTSGQEFSAFIYVEGSSVKAPRMLGDGAVIEGAQIDKNTLRFTLTADRVLKKRITFDVYSVIRRSTDGSVPYTVLDNSVPAGRGYHTFDL